MTKKKERVSYPRPAWNADEVECKTVAAAEKAMAAGKVVKLAGNAIALLLAGSDAPRLIVIHPDCSIVARGSSSPSIVARGSSSPSIVAWESSSPSIEAWESSSPSIVAWGSSSPSIVAWESSSPSIEAWGSSSPSIVARGSSSPSIVAWGSSSPSIVAWESSSPSIEAWGSSSPSIVARGSSSPSIEAWESSSPSIEAWGSSSPSIVARGSSSPSIVAWESSSPSIVAWGYSMIRTRGRVSGTASEHVSLHAWRQSYITGGKQTLINLQTAEDWCGYYGAPIIDGIVVLYKGVDDSYRSGRGGDYTPGTLPVADRWDGGKIECSHGLHWSPTPRHSHEFVTSPARYIAAPHRVEDLVMHWDGQFPQKVMTQSTAGAVFEVDINGKAIAVAALEVEPAQ